MVKFTIPGRLPGLNEYITAERTNRQCAAKMKRQAEDVVIDAARSLGKWKAKGPVSMVYCWFEPNRRRDKDNISSFGRKVIQDALIRGGWLKNDGWKDISGFEDKFFVDAKKPRIVICIYDASKKRCD